MLRISSLFPALISLALLIFTASACTAQPATADEKSLLWKISGPGLSKPSYLFGTIHLLCPADYIWTDAMKQSLAATGRVSFEMDMDDPTVLREGSSGLLKGSDKQLRDYFSEAEYARLSAFVRDSMGLPMTMLQSFSPVVLQLLMLAKTVDCPLPVSYEANIMEEAKKSGKEIIGLERVEEQLELLAGLPDDSSAGMVMQMVDSFSKSKEEFARMLRSYKAQDLQALYRLVQDSREMGDNLGPFLEVRNRKWIPRMREQMKSGPVFFAVGAAHLPGEAGVIRLLRAAGYSVTPVR